ncbi:MAG: cytochrome c oxidase subunit II [Candidatus Dormibacteraceae bacterium]
MPHLDQERRLSDPLPILVVRMHRWLSAGGLMILAGFLFSTSARASTGLDPVVPDGDSPNGQHIHDLYLLISPFAIVVFLIVEILLLIIILKWRRSRLPADYRPPQWHGNLKLEVIWTVIPFLILCVVGYFSAVDLIRDFSKPTDAATDMDIAITAHQFGWTYTYPNGVKVDSEGLQAANSPLVVPVNKLTRLRLDSTDVIHSWWVPDLNGKTDAVPGYSNYTWIQPTHVGEWRGECAELCGAGHATMQIRVKAVSGGDYQAWLNQSLKAQRAQASPSPTPSPIKSAPAPITTTLPYRPMPARASIAHAGR